MARTHFGKTAVPDHINHEILSGRVGGATFRHLAKLHGVSKSHCCRVAGGIGHAARRAKPEPLEDLTWVEGLGYIPRRW